MAADDILRFIPDTKFRRYLLKTFDKDLDGRISTQEALNVKAIDLMCHSGGEDFPGTLEGLQYFHNLEYLSCICDYDVTVVGLDVRNNHKLKYLQCTKMQLDSLDVHCNPELEILNCSLNNLKNLDVSHNPRLRELDCYGNKLLRLDLRNNMQLSLLDCADNDLIELRLCKDAVFESLDCSDNPLLELDLSMVEVLDLECGMHDRLDAETLTTVYFRREQLTPKIKNNIPTRTKCAFVD